ncbi:uncharacterized protein V3H86_009972 [Mergus octosetaceus]
MPHTTPCHATRCRLAHHEALMLQGGAGQRFPRAAGQAPALSSEFPYRAAASHSSGTGSAAPFPQAGGPGRHRLQGCSCPLRWECGGCRGGSVTPGPCGPAGKEVGELAIRWGRAAAPPAGVKAMLEQLRPGSLCQPSPCQSSPGTCGLAQPLQLGRSAAMEAPGVRAELLGSGSAQCPWGERDRPHTGPWCRARQIPVEAGATAARLRPDSSSMVPGRGAACRARGAVGTCVAAQAALCKVAAGHRQLVLQLGGSADGPRLREERRGRSAEARELSTGLRSALLAGLRQAVSPEERRELERLWVLFLSALELFLQDLRQAQHLCCLFSLQGGGAALLRTGLGGRRGGGPEQPLAPPCLEEEMEQVRAVLAEMESTANIPLWTVEATQAAGPGGLGAAPTSQGPGPRSGPCCRVL